MKETAILVKCMLPIEWYVLMMAEITIESVGEGADSQDKASGKAMTYCYKYALLRTFAIPTGKTLTKFPVTN